MATSVHPGPPIPLQRFRFVDTHSFEEARAIQSGAGSSVEVELIDRRQPFAWQANRVALGDLSLVTSRYGAGVRGRSRHGHQDYALVVPRHRAGRATQHDASVVVDPTRAAAMFSPGRPASYESDSHYEGMYVHIPGRVVDATLEALVPDTSREPLRFDLSVDLRAVGGAECLRLLEFMCAEADREVSVLHAPIVAARLSEALVCALLLGLPHNHSKLVRAPTPAAGAAYVRRAEEYLAANVHKHVSVADLAAVAGVSVRTLHAAFRSHRRSTPLAFVRARRLELARAQLLSGEVASVTEVAFACGVEHLGRFSAAYAQRFGESPRETLRKHRRR